LDTWCLPGSIDRAVGVSDHAIGSGDAIPIVVGSKACTYADNIDFERVERTLSIGFVDIDWINAVPPRSPGCSAPCRRKCARRR
jgi:hypothetical protein